jgi:hypothetical protein
VPPSGAESLIFEDEMSHLVPDGKAQLGRAPARNLQHGAHRLAGGDRFLRERLRVRGDTAIAPSAFTNRISSGMSVFFVQKECGLSVP